MKTVKLLSLLIMLFIAKSYGQQLPSDIRTAVKTDDAKTLAKLITKENLNECYDMGSMCTLLSIAIHENKPNCFKLLIEKGADVNANCDYRSPLIHAAKYGTLDVVKALIAKGAMPDYVAPDGKTAIAQAEKYGKPGVADYLKNLKN